MWDGKESIGERTMNNFDAIKQMPLKDFAQLVFHVARFDCNNAEEFEAFLNKKVDVALERTVKEALQKMQCSNSN